MPENNDIKPAQNTNGEIPADTVSSSDRSNDRSEPNTQLLQSEFDRLKNEHLYLRAEFDNYRKQAIKERSDLMKFGSERLLLDVLGVLDNFERAVENAEQSNFEMYKKGVELTAAELRAILSRFGVQEVPTLKVAFDPSLHEALGSEESAEIPAGHIKTVYKKAYKLHDRVLRPAQVVVAKAPSANS